MRMGEFQLPRIRAGCPEKVADLTPGSAFIRSMRRAYKAFNCSGLYPANFALNFTRRRLWRLKPKSWFSRLRSVRRKSPALASRTSESVTCDTTRSLGRRRPDDPPELAAVRALVPSEGATLIRETRRAGARPKRIPVKSDTPRVKS